MPVTANAANLSPGRSLFRHHQFIIGVLHRKHKATERLIRGGVLSHISPLLGGRSHRLLPSNAVHPGIVFTFFVCVTFMTTVMGIVEAGSTAFVQIDQEVTALVAVRERDLGSCQRSQILRRFGFRFWIGSATHR